MTYKKAIKVLEELWRYEYTTKYTTQEIREAIDIAIVSLAMLGDIKAHRLLSSISKEHFDKLPDLSKGYQLGWNGALNAIETEFNYKSGQGD